MEDNLSIGIDIGGTNIKAGLVDQDRIVGEIIEVKTPNTFEDFKQELGAIIDQFKQSYSESQISVGIGLPGVLNRDQSKIVCCPNLSYLDGIGFSDLLPDHQPVLGNDADMALFGELQLGNLWNDDVLLLTLGTGLGSAYYLAGKGSWELNMAGEAGHLKIVPEGRVCTCGGKGCLGSYFSSTAIINEAKEKIGPEIDEVESVFELMRQGDDKARSIIEQSAKMLGIGIANLVNVLGVSRVILGGKISLSYEWFIEPVYESAKANIFTFSDRTFSIEQSKNIDVAAIVGSANYSLKNTI